MATTLGIIPSSSLTHSLVSQKGFAKEVEISLALGGGVRALWVSETPFGKRNIMLPNT